jgi:hypothetical protein
VSDGSVSLDLIIRMVLEGRGGELGKEQLEALKKAAEDVSDAGQQAYDSLLKLNQEPTSKGDAANDARAAARAQAEAAAAIKQSDMSAGAGLATGDPAETLKKMAAAERAAAEEKENARKVTKGAKEEQVEDTKETDKATTAKKSLREGIRGLATEFPHLGQVIAAVASPLGAVVALVAAAASKAAEYIRSVEEMAAKTQQFATISDRVDPLSVIRESIATDTANFITNFAQIQTAAEKLSTGLAQVTAAYLQQQQMMQQLDDETLKKTIAQINARVALKQITQFEGNMEIARAQDAARDRREQREIESLERRSKLAKEEAENQRKVAEEAKRGLGGLDIEAQTDAANKAADIAKSTKDVNDAELKKLEKTQEMILEFRSFAARQGGSAWEMISNQATASTLGGQLWAKGARTPEQLAQLESETITRTAELKKQNEQAALAAKQEADRLAKMTGERARLQQAAMEAETARVQAEQEAAKLAKEHVMRSENQTRIDEQRQEASQANAAAMQAQRDRAARVQQLEVQMEELRRRQVQNPDDLGVRMQINRTQGELLNLRNWRPEDQPLNRARNAREEAESQAEIQRRIREQFNRDNRSLDGAARGIESFGAGVEKVGAGVERAVAATNRRIEAVARRLDDVESRVAAQRV